MNELIERVNNLRNVSRTGLGSSVRKVAVVLCSSRGGSSLVKEILAAHPDVASLDGELEPFLALTGNGFGRNSDSDALGTLANREALVDNIFDELTVPAEECLSLDWVRSRWEKRLLLQFPDLFATAEGYAHLVHSLDAAIARIHRCDIRDESEMQEIVLDQVFSHEPWRIGFYDGRARSTLGRCFSEASKIEEPPFVSPKLKRRPFCARDVEDKVLLFKTPSDAYRIGMYEQLFPNADIRYLHLTRGYAQSVNGLMDGWLSEVGFFSQDLKRASVQLDIKGYSDRVVFGKRWWKFDLPPNWMSFVSSSLEEVCLNQWQSTHTAILESGVSAMKFSFERLMADPEPVAKQMMRYLGLRECRIASSLPVTMATEKPRADRWKKREELLLELGKRAEVRSMMQSLGYEMDPRTWH